MIPVLDFAGRTAPVAVDFVEVIALFSFVRPVHPVSAVRGAQRPQVVRVREAGEANLLQTGGRTSISVVVVPIIASFAELGLIVPVPALVAGKQETEVGHGTEEATLDLAVLVAPISIVGIAVVAVFAQVSQAVATQGVVDSLADRGVADERMAFPPQIDLAVLATPFGVAVIASFLEVVEGLEDCVAASVEAHTSGREASVDETCAVVLGLDETLVRTPVAVGASVVAVLSRLPDPVVVALE